MARSAELGQLTGSEWHRLQDAVARLEQAWQQADDVNLARFLPPTPPSLRLLFLYELIKTDLQERCHRQRFVPLEDYPKRYPELGPVADLPTPLVYEEFRARYLYGDRPPLEAYRARFPSRFEDLKRLVKQHPVETLRETLDCRHLVPDQTPASPLPVAQPASVTPMVEPLTPSLPSPAGPVTPAARPVVQGRLRLDGDFELLDRLGAGQFGEVFRARAPGGVEVAVKRLFRPLDDESTQRELQALDLLRSLHHPFLLQNLMNGAVDGRLVIVMELAEDSLNDRFKACRQEGLPGIPAEELVAYFLEAAEALDFLHGHNVMHRDIKPANLLRLRGHAKVADFGLARLHESHLADGTFCGTPLYMPPEVWRHQISVHSDQYSLAVTYVEMRLGRRLHDASDPITVGRQHLRATPDLEPLPRDEQAVLFRALAKNPDQRFPSCLEFVRALARAIAPPPPPPVRPAASRLAWLIRGVWLAIVLCLSVLVWRLWPNGTSDPPPQPPSPPPPQVRGWLPSLDFVPGEGAKLSHGLYSRIFYPLKDAAPLVFLLIRSEKAGDLPDYYILRDKVSNEQFHAILKKRRMQELLREYEKKHPGSVGRKWNQSRIEHVCRYAALGLPVNSWAPLAGCAAVATADSVWREPVFYVTVTEAYCFAVCVGEEYGALPTVNQWEKAGGRHKGAKGPWDSKPQQRVTEKPQGPAVKLEGIAVSIPLPLPIGISSADVSWCGCRDMSGNGGEWMRNVKVPRAGYHFVPLPKPTIDDAVLLRGAAFYDFNPFTFAVGDDTNPPLEYHKSIDYVSFRTVLEVPPDR